MPPEARRLIDVTREALNRGIGAARAGARQPGGMQGWQIAVVAFAAAVWFAVTDEIHQAWVPGRTVDTMDFIADAAGAGAGTLAWYFLLRSRVWKKRHIIV